MKKLIGGCLGLGMLMVIALIVLIVQAWHFWGGVTPADGEVITIEIEPGESVSAIAERLRQEGIIQSEFWFKAFARVSSDATGIQAGIHQIPKQINYQELLKNLANAPAVDIQVTFPEGRTAAEYAPIVTSNFSITEAEWIAAAKPYEGFLFPETYRFFPDATAEDIVNKMRQTFEERVAAEGLNIDMETLIFASILEREARLPEDYRTTAGTLQNRLTIGMALQVDSSILYVLPSFDKNYDSPYNTYLYAGLTPTPIGNPGILALQAAADPADVPYFYFVNRQSDGKAFYAETYAEHQVNIDRYLR